MNRNLSWPFRTHGQFMCIAFAIASFVAVSVLPSSAQQSPPSPLDLTLLYYKFSKLPLPWHDVLLNFNEYRSARDEFQRRDVGGRIKSVIEERMSEISVDSTFIFLTETTLGEYDFVKGAFPTSLPPYMHSVFSSQIGGPPVAINFMNAQVASYWALPEDAARPVSQKLSRARRVVAEIEYRAMRTREDSLQMQIRRIIDVNIVKIRFKVRDTGEILGVLTI